MSQRRSTSSVSLASYDSVDIGCCFPRKKPAQTTFAKEGSERTPSPTAPTELAPTELKEEEEISASSKNNSDNVIRRFSTKRREIVEQGHECLRHASDLIYQHRNSLGQISQELEDRWAQLFHVAPVAQKLTKGRQQPKEFYENAQKLLQDVEEELRKAEERKHGAPSKAPGFIPRYAASIRSAARSVRSQLSKITNRRQTAAPSRRHQLEETSLLASQIDPNGHYRTPYYPPEDGVESLRATSRMPSSNLERRNQSTRYPPMSVHSAQLESALSADRAIPQPPHVNPHDGQSIPNLAATAQVPSVYTQQVGSHPAFTGGYVPSESKEKEKEKERRRDDRNQNYDSRHRGYYSSSRDRDKYRYDDYYRSSRDGKYRDRDRDRDRDYERSYRRHRSSQDYYDDRRYRSSRDDRSRDDRYKDRYEDRYKDRYEDRYKDRYEDRYKDRDRDRYKDRDRDRDRYERHRHRSDDRRGSRSRYNSQVPASTALTAPAEPTAPAENTVQTTFQDPVTVIADESSPTRFQEVFTDAGTVRE